MTQQEVQKLRESVPLYAEKLLKIRDKSGNLVPFVFNNVQREVDRLLEFHIRRHRCIMYILKSRQVGISTWAEARIFHRAHLYPNTRNAILAHDIQGAENVYNISRTFYDNLPDGIRPMTRYSTRKQIVFENPNKLDRHSNPGLKSRIDVFTAGKSTSGRSFTFTCLHFSEFAFAPDGQEIISSLIPALPAIPGRFIILETTANGMDNFAFDYWQMFKDVHERNQESSEFVPVFIPWYMDSTCSTPFHSDKERERFKATLSGEEQTLRRCFKLTLEQLNWRRNQIIAMGGDEELFFQEYPTTDIEAFRTSVRRVFIKTHIDLAYTKTTAPIFEGEISLTGNLINRPDGPLKIWEFPHPNKEYVVGVDPIGEGAIGKRRDNAAIQVIEKESLTQVAEMVTQLESMQLAGYVRELATLYNNALVVPEINVGMTLVYELAKDYYNIYRREAFDSLYPTQTDRLGWRTDLRTKQLIVDYATFCFHNGHCKVNSRDLLAEMMTFTHNNTESNARDDRVMAWMIALFIAGRLRQTYEASHKKKSILTATDAAMVDVDEWNEHFGIETETPHWMTL